jgi:hypothetical protein
LQDSYRKAPLPSDAALVKVPNVFEQIVAGTAEVSFVYRDDKVAAVMDIQPLNPGHVLVIPLEPARFLCELKDDIAAHMFVIGKNAWLRRFVAPLWNAKGCIFFLQTAQRPDRKFLTCTFTLFPGTERMDLG